MFVDFSKAQKQYLPVKFSNGVEIQLEEPTLREVECLDQIKNHGRVSDITEAITKIINRNREKQEFKKDEIYELLTYSQMKQLLDEYMKEFILDTEKN